VIDVDRRRSPHARHADADAAGALADEDRQRVARGRVELLGIVDAAMSVSGGKHDRGATTGPRADRSRFVDAAMSVTPDFHSTSSKWRIACMRRTSRRSLS
jgi:hypothetical protein